MRGLTPIFIILAVGLFHSTAAATGRFYGTLNATYQHTTRETTTRVSIDTTSDSSQTIESVSDYGQSQLLINYDDVLFSKNYLRLASSIYGRQVNDAGKWDVRSIYYLDLKSTGYAYSGSYSPYSQTVPLHSGDSTLGTYKLLYRDWRNTIGLNYSRWPSFNLTYNLGKSFDNRDVRGLDTRSRNVILESNYALGSIAVRGNYTQSRTENRLTAPRNVNSFRTMNGTTSFARDFPRLGYLSTTYSFLDSKIQTQSTEIVVPLRAKVHSVTGFYNTRSYHGLSGSAGYSGRFTRSRTPQDKFNNRDESFSGQVGYAPFSFLSFDLTKIYQIATRTGGHQISEYLTVSSTVKRYLRRGLDTRISWARTFYQQVDRGEDSTAPRGGYSTDAYYASLAAIPYPHTRLLCDLSISRNNAPEATSRRYLITRSMNLLLNASRRLEGRVGASFSYQGPELSLDRSYSRNLNAGASYFPGGNINMNLTYVHSILNSTPRLSNSSLNTYIGYTYRQVLSLYLSLNRQLQEIPEQTGTGDLQKLTVRPYTINAQAQLRLTAKSTFTLGYIHSDGSSTAGPSNKSGTLQAVYNGQF